MLQEQHQKQQQTVLTSTGPTQHAVYFSQPYQTTSVISSYRHRQSTLSGALMIVAGTLNVIFGIAEMAVVAKDLFYYYIIGMANGGGGIVCGIMVSYHGLLYTIHYSYVTLQHIMSLLLL